MEGERRGEKKVTGVGKRGVWERGKRGRGKRAKTLNREKTH